MIRIIPPPIHLGLMLGSNGLLDYIKARQEIDVNHIVLSLQFSKANIEATLECLVDEVLHQFHITGRSND